jgi:hypothetical protein
MTEAGDSFVRADSDPEIGVRITLCQPCERIVTRARTIDVMPGALIQDFRDDLGILEGRTTENVRPR